jgi:hypothetical protein
MSVFGVGVIGSVVADRNREGHVPHNVWTPVIANSFDYRDVILVA